MGFPIVFGIVVEATYVNLLNFLASVCYIIMIGVLPSEAEWVGVVLVEFVTTSIDSLPTSKCEDIGGRSAEGAWGEH